MEGQYMPSRKITLRTAVVVVLLAIIGGGLMVWRTLTATDTLLRTIPLTAPSAPGDIRIDEQASRAVINGDAPGGLDRSALTLLDTRSGDIVRTIRLTNSARLSVAIASQAGRIVVLDSGSRYNTWGTTVRLLDERSGALVRTTTVGLDPLAVAVEERAGHVFVASTGPSDRYGNARGAGTVSMLDARSGALLHMAKVGLRPQEMADDERTGRLFVANYTGNSVSVLDTRTGAVIATTRVGIDPTSIAVDDQTGRVFVAAEGSNIVSMLDARTGALLRIIATGFPTALAVDRTAGHLLVASVGPHTPAGISLLDARTGALISRVETGGSPEDIAVDERTGRAFVTDTQLGRRLYDPLHHLLGVGLSWAGENNMDGMSVIDTRSGNLLRTIHTGPAARLGVAVDARAGHAFVVSYQNRNAQMFDATQ